MPRKCRQVRRIETPEQEALVTNNMALVRWTIGRSLPRIKAAHLEPDEVEGELFLTLVNAAAAFSPALGFKFSTYATRSMFKKIATMAARQKCLCRTAKVESIDKLVGDRITYRDQIYDPAPGPCEVAEVKEEVALLSAAVVKVEPEHAAIIRERAKGRTLRQIGKRLGCSGEGARWKFKKAAERVMEFLPVGMVQP